MNRKRWQAAAAGIGVMLAMSACSSSSGGNAAGASGGGGAPAASPAADASAKPVTITYESFTPAKPEMDKLIAEFEKEYPNIKVEQKLHANETEAYQALRVAFVSGEGPDVTTLNPGSPLKEFSSQLQPIDEFAQQEWGDDWKSKFVPDALTLGTLNDQVYGLPNGGQSNGLIWYNKNVFDKLSLKEPQTYDDLKRIADTLRENNYQPLLIGAKDPWTLTDTFQVFLNEFAPGLQYKAYNKEAKFDDPNVVKAFDMWKKMFDDKIFQDNAFGMTQYMDAYNAMLDQKAAMFDNGSWNLDIFGTPDVKAKVDAIDFGVMPFPDLNGDGKLSPVTTSNNFVVMNKNSKNKDAAWKFLEFVTYGKGQGILMDHFLDIPAVTDARTLGVQVSPNASQVRDRIAEITDSSASGMTGIITPKVESALDDVLTQVALDKMSSADAAKTVQAAIDAN